MALQTILQHEIATQFIYPFLLVFVLVFAILQKTKLLSANKQIDAIISFVIGLILVSALQPKLIISNLMLFLSIALVIVFVGLLLWGFIMGDDQSLSLWEGSKPWFKWISGIVILLSVIIAVLWASGLHTSVIDALFYQSWSSSLWTNVFFIVVVVAALAVILYGGSKAKS